jgi:archaellum biogenesis protein FlaJ (TadC family)
MASHKQHSETHRRQRAKNLTVLALLLGLVVLFYLITLVRMGAPQ